MTRVGLHDYVTDPLLPQKDGVNLAHENIAQLLRDCSAPDINIQFHDFIRLFEDENYARQMLGSLDCVVSNVGPHAHYYFWLRERLDLKFRIIRDVRTAIWSSYLLQEHLCQPLLRDGDTLLVASQYTLDIYHQMFPHLFYYPSAICYPLTVCFPENRPHAKESTIRQSDTISTLGYLGRLSEDKNFPCLIDLLIQLNSIPGKKYRLVACGDIHSSSCAPDLIRARLLEALGSHDCFIYHSPCSNGEIWTFLSNVDVLLFPSTSNLETLGRVLIEASYARIPVISGDHAAAPELVAPEGLCAVNYRSNEMFSAHYDHNMGSVSVGSLAEALTRSIRPSDCYERYREHPNYFVKLLTDIPDPHSLDSGVQRSHLLDTLVVKTPPALNHSQAIELISECTSWFVTLQSRHTSEYASHSLKLLAMSRYPERTQRYLNRNLMTSGDFTNVGGIDIELCHLMGFYPEFYMASDRNICKNISPHLALEIS